MNETTTPSELESAQRRLRSALREALGVLEESTEQRGWWDAAKRAESAVVRAFSELRAAQPTAIHHVPGWRPESDALDDDEGD